MLVRESISKAQLRQVLLQSKKVKIFKIFLMVIKINKCDEFRQWKDVKFGSLV